MVKDRTNYKFDDTDFSLINHLEIVDTEGILNCLHLLHPIYRNKDVKIYIHTKDTLQFTPQSLKGVLGIYKLDEKNIEIFVCNYIDFLKRHSEAINLTTLIGVVHELRHSVQHKLMPNTFNNIITGKKKYFSSMDQDEYKDQYLEKDARRFVRRFIKTNKEKINRNLNIKTDWEMIDDIVYIDKLEIKL